MSTLSEWLATEPAPTGTFYFQEGNMIGCVRGDFIDLATSPVGFGETHEAALRDLAREEQKLQPRPMADEELPPR